MRMFAKKMQYFLMRNPVPISREEARILRSQRARIFANSLPKSGTNLLKRFVNLLPSVLPRYTYHIDHSIRGWERQIELVRPGQAVTAHLRHDSALVSTLQQHGFKMLFISRDPRDVIVSNAFYIASKDRTHRLHRYYTSLPGKDDWISAGIQGIPGELLPDGIRAKGLGEHLEDFMPWLDEKACLCVRYEDLIGEKGGGSDELQLEWVRRMVEHLGLDLAETELQRIAGNLFYSGARTFRKGAIGDWKSHLTEAHKVAIKATCGQALIRLGYESSDTW